MYNSRSSFSFLMVLMLFTVSAEYPHELQITNDPSSQNSPAIYGATVVWTDYRQGNADIYGYNLDTGEELQITTNPEDQFSPAIYGDVVVWEDDRNGDRDIYGYNLESREEFQITTDPGSHCAPAICKNIVVWSDYRQGYGNSDVYGYDLNTGKEFQITTDKDEQDDVAIYNNIVVWEDERGVNGDVLCGYNLETEEEFRVHKSYWYFILENSQHNPAIFEDTVVWTTGLDYEIYSYNMSTSREVKIAVAQKVPCVPGKNCMQVRPAIHSNIAVWADTRNGNSDICGYDLDTGEEFQITTNPEDQYSPAIYGNVVAWTDRRNGRGDIYCCDISTVPRSRPLAVSREALYLFAGVVALAVIVFVVRKKESKLRAQ